MSAAEYLSEPDEEMGPETEAGAPTEIHPLEEGEVQAILEAEIRDAIGYNQTTLSDQRREGLERYLSVPWNAQENQSSASLDYVRDTIEWVMPALVRMYLGGSKTVSLGAVGPQDEPTARSAGKALNHLFREELSGFEILYDGFKSALIEKTGVWSIRTEQRMHDVRIETYEGKTDIELELMMAAGGVKLVSREPAGMGPMVTPQGIQMVPLWNVKVRRERTKLHVIVTGVPNEEFLIGRKERALDDETRFCGWRRRVTLSDILDMGLPGVTLEDLLNLPASDRLANEDAESVRRDAEDEQPYTDSWRSDVVSREVWLNDITIRIDQDGDGHAELRRILCVGDNAPTILYNAYCNSVDYASVTPIRLPYKWAGLSYADILKQLEYIGTTVLRQILDNFYRTNHARLAFPEGEVEIDDVISVRPGQYIRTRGGRPADVLMQLDAPQLGPAGNDLLRLTDQMREDRSGGSRFNQGLDASALSESTATGMMQMMGAAAARIELVARVFEPGVKRLFRLLLRKLQETPNQERMLKLGGEWTPVDPSQWNTDWAVTVHVGLGQGRMQERVQQLDKILGMQVNAMTQGTQMADREELYNTAEDLIDAMGFPSASRYFKNPATLPPMPPPQPSIDQQLKSQQVEVARAGAVVKEGQLRETQRDHTLEDQRTRLEIDSRERVEMTRIAAQVRIAELNCQCQKETAALRPKPTAAKRTPAKKKGSK